MQKTGRLNKAGVPILKPSSTPSTGRTIGENVAITRNMIDKATSNAPRGSNLINGK